MPRLCSLSLALLACVCLSVPTAHAQIAAPTLTAQGVSYNRYFTEGELTMEVFIISSTGRTGIFEIGTDTRLLELITVAGFAPPPRSEGTINRITLSVVRPSINNEPIYKARLEEFVREPERHPALQEGDVILVESVQKRKFTWREAISILSGVTSLLVFLNGIGVIRFTRRR